MELIILVLIVIVVGALLGGNSFGECLRIGFDECLRIGCGCLIIAIAGAAVLLGLGWWTL